MSAGKKLRPVVYLQAYRQHLTVASALAIGALLYQFSFYLAIAFLFSLFLSPVFHRKYSRIHINTSLISQCNSKCVSFYRYQIQNLDIFLSKLTKWKVIDTSLTKLNIGIQTPPNFGPILSLDVASQQNQLLQFFGSNHKPLAIEYDTPQYIPDDMRSLPNFARVTIDDLRNKTESQSKFAESIRKCGFAVITLPQSQSTMFDQLYQWMREFIGGNPTVTHKKKHCANLNSSDKYPFTMIQYVNEQMRETIEFQCKSDPTFTPAIAYETCYEMSGFVTDILLKYAKSQSPLIDLVDPTYIESNKRCVANSRFRILYYPSKSQIVTEQSLLRKAEASMRTILFNIIRMARNFIWQSLDVLRKSHPKKSDSISDASVSASAQTEAYRYGAQYYDSFTYLPHCDLGLITISARATTPGLQIVPPGGKQFIDADYSVLTSNDDILVYCGYEMSCLSGGFYQPLLHRVRLDWERMGPYQPRLAMPFFYRLDLNAKLPVYTNKAVETILQQSRHDNDDDDDALSDKSNSILALSDKKAVVQKWIPVRSLVTDIRRERMVRSMPVYLTRWVTLNVMPILQKFVNVW